MNSEASGNWLLGCSPPSVKVPEVGSRVPVVMAALTFRSARNEVRDFAA